MGTVNGMISMHNTQSDNDQVFYWNAFGPNCNGIVPSPIKDLVFNPGEDMFLCIRKDGQIILFGGAERLYKMLFDVPPSGVSRAVWIDSVSGDFLVASPTAGVLRLFNAA